MITFGGQTGGYSGRSDHIAPAFVLGGIKKKSRDGFHRVRFRVKKKQSERLVTGYAIESYDLSVDVKFSAEYFGDHLQRTVQ